MSVHVFYGWRVVAACFVIAACAWSLGLFGSSVYLQAVTAAHGWPVADVATAITLFFLVSAAVQRPVGRSIDRWGPRPVLLLGVACMASGVALIGQVSMPWQLYPCFVLLGIGWSTLSMTGITTTVAPWFERHQGRSMTLAIMGASIGAIAGVPLLLLAIATLGLGRGLIAAGIVVAVLLVPLIWRVLRFRGPADIGLQRDGDALAAQTETVVLAPPIATAANSRLLLWSAAAAFALNSSKIKAMFGTPELFMRMVRESYAALYKPAEVTFRDVVDMDGIIAQFVYVRGRDGIPRLAVYPMEHDADGEWRINGCMLWSVPESAV